jgi:hypothetical protein
MTTTNSPAYPNPYPQSYATGAYPAQPGQAQGGPSCGAPPAADTFQRQQPFYAPGPTAYGVPPVGQGGTYAPIAVLPRPVVVPNQSINAGPLPPKAEIEAGHWPVNAVIGAREVFHFNPLHVKLNSALREGGRITERELGEVSRKYLKFTSVDGARWSERRHGIGNKWYFLRMPWNRVYVLREFDPSSRDGVRAMRSLCEDLHRQGGEYPGFDWGTNGIDQSRFTFDIVPG